MTVEKKIIRDFLSELNNQHIKIGDDDSLLVAGLIDSLTIVQLIISIEEQYKIKIRENELLPENFETINGIVDFLTKKGV